jgi:hypothetical protein
MRQQRAQRMGTTTPVLRSGTDLPASGFAMLVDGRVKREFNSEEAAVNTAIDLKGRFPMLQVKVYDAETRQSETIELVA